MTRLAPLWQQNGTYPAQTDRTLMAALWPNPATNGGAISSLSTTNMAITVAPGFAAVPLGPGGSNYCELCRWDAPEVVTPAAGPGAGNSRIDLIVCQVRDSVVDAGSNNDFLITIAQGAPAATPSPPALPANAVALWQITVPAGATTANLVTTADLRPHGLGPEPALAAAAPISSYTDSTTGEVWVAKGGVNGGAYRKARDVLHARYHRAATFNFATTIAAFGHDTPDSDPYSLYNPNSGYITFPVSGLWRIDHTMAGTATAAGQWLQAILAFAGGGIMAYGMVQSGTAQWMQGTATLVAIWAAGQQGITQMTASAALAGQVTGGVPCKLTVDYLGTG